MACHVRLLRLLMRSMPLLMRLHSAACCVYYCVYVHITQIPGLLEDSTGGAEEGAEEGAGGGGGGRPAIFVHMNDDYIFTSAIRPQDLFGPTCAGANHATFGSHLYMNDHFTKTGSGQNIGTSTQVSPPSPRPS
jgi:hypothetical protein